MNPTAVLLLEALLAAACRARLTFGPGERATLSEALRVLEARRYAAEDAAVCERIALLQSSHGEPVSALP